MATGFLHGSRCYTSQALADSAYWGGVPPVITPGKLTTVSLSGGIWTVNQFDTNSGQALISSTQVPSVSYPVCDPMEAFNDGQTLGMGVALAMIAAFLIRIMAWGTR